ncbi:MAG: hypothetical protein KBT36_11820 [Kurthia sp.]|nr:hypothetical protein [Candidatus Kurthia equi]
MGIPEQIQTVQVPIGRLTAKFRSTIYYQNGNELVRSKEYLEVGEQVNVYAIHEDTGDIGNGKFIKEVDTTHFEITYGKLLILGENVRAYSRNGVLLRPLKKGSEFNVINLYKAENDIILYKINSLEYLSSADEIEFIMGYFIPQEDTFSVMGNKSIAHRKGNPIPFKYVNSGRIILLDNSVLNTSSIKGKFT